MSIPNARIRDLLDGPTGMCGQASGHRAERHKDAWDDGLRAGNGFCVAETGLVGENLCGRTRKSFVAPVSVRDGRFHAAGYCHRGRRMS